MKNKYVVAKIVFVKFNQFCIAESGEKKFFLSFESGPKLFSVDVEGAAVFNGHFARSIIMKDDVVLIEPGKYSREHDKTYALSWGMINEARKAEDGFIQPKIYVVFRRGRAEKSGRWSEWEKFDTGGVDQLIHRHSARDGKRDSDTDCLAPTYRTMGFVYETKFAHINEGKEVWCGDPRPMEKTGPLYKVVRLTSGCEPRGLAQGDVATISYEYPRLKSGQDTLKSGKNFQIIWYRMVSGGQWEICNADPRPFEKGISDPSNEGDIINMTTDLVSKMTGKFQQSAAA